MPKSSTTIALVACSKKKLDHPARAKDLYCSTWFRLARAWAETNADQWWILSAEHGLVHPDQILAPYDRTLPPYKVMRKSNQSYDWTTMVIGQLYWRTPIHGRFKPCQDEDEKKEITAILLAGERYRDSIEYLLRLNPRVITEAPLAHMSIGQQQRWLKENT